VLGLQVHRASFVQDFLKLSLIAPRLLARLVVLNSHDFLVWLALSGVPLVVPLAPIKVVVAIALLVIVALGEAIILLIILIGHHAIMPRSSTVVVGR
jgi:hypothetical protein